MSKTAHLILESCANSCNKVTGLLPACSLSITKSRFKFYHQQSTTDRLESHHALEVLCTQHDWLEIQFQGRGFDEIPILQKVTVSDSSALLAYLHIDVLSDAVARVCSDLARLLATAPDWVNDALRGCSDAWSNGKTYKGFSWKHFDGLAFGIRLISFAESHSDLKTDFRTASVKALGNSKALEKNISLIAKLLRLKSDSYADLSNEEVLGNWGITRFAPLMRLSGASTACFSHGELDTQFADPYLAIPLDNLERLSLQREPAYVLFIENLASFERYTRTIRDSGLVFYTGGFPSNHWIRVVRTLKSQLSQQCPFYHWGDIDVGGYKILAYCERSLSINIRPFRMHGNEGSQQDRDIPLEELIAALECTGLHIQDLKQKLISQSKAGGLQYWVEQEALDPISPLDFLSNAERSTQ